jgi:hypothetical protein
MVWSMVEEESGQMIHLRSYSAKSSPAGLREELTTKLPALRRATARTKVMYPTVPFYLSVYIVPTR